MELDSSVLSVKLKLPYCYWCRNVRFAFFQPAENEMITLLHFHLLNPIMVGKKKAKDIQFYTEVMDVVQTLDGTRRSMYDPDEIEEEQRERDRCIKASDLEGNDPVTMFSSLCFWVFTTKEQIASLIKETVNPFPMN